MMVASFAVAIAYVAEQWGSTGEAPTVMTGCVTANIAGQILGRMLMGFLAQYVDWHRAFLTLGALNLLGGFLLWTCCQGPGAGESRIRVRHSCGSLRICAMCAWLAAFSRGS